jgi:chromosome partitioning protein
MQVITLMAQKGGTGKTTAAINFAGAALIAGRKPLIIDVDMQASACKWADRRGVESSPHVIDAQPSRLMAALEKAAGMGFDFILIDTPAKSGEAGLAAARVSNLVVIPYRPQILDLETVESSRDLIRLANNVPAIALLNAVPPVGFRRRQEAADFLKQYDISICPHVISQRAVFGDAMAAGQSVLEFEPDGKASQEILIAYNYLSQLVGKLASRETADGTTKSRRAS